MKAAIFSCKGLGDGLISLLLSNNLYLNGYRVDTFHGSLDQMQSFFSHLPIKKYPNEDKIDQILKFYDQIFVSYNESSSFIMKLIKEGKKIFIDKVFVLNPCPSKKIGGQPYHRDALFDPSINMVDNILLFCKKILKLKKTSKKIDLKIDKNLTFKKFEKRVILHPASAKKSKNWPINKYIKLAQVLKLKGYDPVFVIKENEREEFKIIEEKKIILKSFDNLKNLTNFIYESSFMIGNDSGIGHLSSLLGLRTISIFRNHRSANLWRPGWSQNEAIFPARFIPNISVYRLRDKHWKRFISFRKILKHFYKRT
ncbi:MAG: hypothetical protein KR126chlam4_00003 [Candidatus Anoxychlamydiales bacterium]|nr:hypothetical protein [Candidatus Anoxychlamydiales bacterium]NGX40187.1 hypothetical protein [Candidatus Anoxychlamydiales bacterium]HEU63823.1 lipopolysaccharide heptosyltransferase family protein [Chlamydiota bacterium]